MPATRAPRATQATRRPILRATMRLRGAAPLSRAVAVMSLWVVATPAKCQSSSPSTTRGPTGAAFTLRSRNTGSLCSVTQNGGCITGGSGAGANYNDNEQCIFSVTRNTTLHAWRLDTEQGLGFLSISGGGLRFSGAHGPGGVSVPEGANVTWNSDYVNTRRGFLVCGSSPPPTPPTLSPTVRLTQSTASSTSSTFTSTPEAQTVFSVDLNGRGLTTADIHGMLPFPPSTQTIELGQNYISSIPPGAFDSLSALTELGLGLNSITSIPSGAFGGLSALTELGLFSNNIISIPSGAFDSLSALTVLRLDWNSITSITSIPPGALDGLSALTQLYLGSNSISSIPPGAFDSLSALTVLRLDLNSITGIPSGAFGGLSALTELGLFSNNIISIPPGAFDSLPALTVLRLDWNSITSIPSGALDGLSALTQLYLDSNSISSIPSGAFDSLSALTVLRLDLNSITGIPSGAFDGLSALTELGLFSNNIISIPPGAFDSLSALTVLRLDWNSISSIPSGAFDSLSALTQLYLDSNSISSIPSGAFDSLSALTELGLESNSISSIPSGAFDSLSALTVLGLDSNSITGIPPGAFDGLSALTELGLFSNNIISIPSGAFDSLSALTVLRLDWNSITSIPSGALDGLSALTVLGLDSNSITSIPSGAFDSLSALTELGLNSNSISSIPSGAFDSLSALTRLDLGSNLITRVGADMFVVLQNLSFLHISDNTHLTIIPHSTFDGMRHLQNLKIQNNQIVTLDVSSLHRLNRFTIVPRGSLDQPCQVTDGGRCITDGSGPGNDYQNLQFCTFTVLRDTILTTTPGQFATEDGYGVVTIDDRRYSGSVGPRSVDVHTGTRISWMSDSSNTERGWTICATSAPTVGSPIFQAGALPQLELEPSRISEQRTTATDSTQVYGSYSQTQWALGTTYTALPPNVTAAHTEAAGFTTRANVAVPGITYSPSWSRRPPPGFFVDASTGELLIRVPQTAPRQIRTATLLAHTSGAAPAVVHRFTFEMLPSDTVNASNGPNGRDCDRTSQRSDTTLFDGRFHCNCSGVTNISLNCNTAPSMPPGSKNSVTAAEVSAGVSVAIVVVLITVVVAVLRMRSSRARLLPADLEALQAELIKELGITQQDPQTSDLEEAPVELPLEIPRKNVTLLETLGSGNFGEVTKAMYRLRGDTRNNDLNIEVAVKTLIDTTNIAARDEFLKEALVTHQFAHRNVCQMLGIVTAGEPYLLVLEYCSKGALKTYLEVHGDAAEVHHLIKILHGIAAGMTYLAPRKFVHRDLAARNVLLDGAEVPKVCDFGLSRGAIDGKDYYRPSEQGEMMLPLRWTDPAIFEAAEDDDKVVRFSELTDVWSFGVTAIEAFTAAAMPYTGWMDFYILMQLNDGYRLPRPARCPERLYNLVISPCWCSLDARPTFAQLLLRLGECHGDLKSQQTKSADDPFDLLFAETQVHRSPTARYVNQSVVDQGVNKKIVNAPARSSVVYGSLCNGTEPPIVYGVPDIPNDASTRDAVVYSAPGSSPVPAVVCGVPKHNVAKGMPAGANATRMPSSDAAHNLQRDPHMQLHSPMHDVYEDECDDDGSMMGISGGYMEVESSPRVGRGASHQQPVLDRCMGETTL